MTLISTLKSRFEANMNRHPGIKWETVEKLLSKEKLRSLEQMEKSGGEPDVVTLGKAKEIAFVDCSAQSPAGRRSLCYDRAALDARKENKPKGSAVEMAAKWGVELLTEECREPPGHVRSVQHSALGFQLKAYRS